MPRIPEFTIPTVDLQPQRMVAAQSPSIEPMRNFAPEQMQKLGEGILRAGQGAIMIQNHIDDAKVRESDSLLADYTAEALANRDTGYKFKIGKAALNSYQSTIDGYNARRRDIEATLTNDVQRKMFAQQADRRTNSFLTDVNEHYVKQAKVFDSATTSARISSKQRDAVTYRDDPERLNQLLRGQDSITSEVARLAELNGMPTVGEGSEIYQDTVRSKLAEVHSGIITSYLAEDRVEDAAKYFQKLDQQKDLDPETSSKMQSVLRKRSEEYISYRIADEIHKGGGSIVDKLNAVRAYYESKDQKDMTPDIRRMVEQKLRQSDSDQRVAEANQGVEDFTAAQEFLRKPENYRKTVDDLATWDPERWERLQKSGKIDSLVSWINNGNRFYTDPRALDELYVARELVEPTKIRVPVVLPGAQDVVMVTKTIKPLRDMTPNEIRHTYGGRLSDPELNHWINVAAGGRSGRSSSGAGGMTVDDAAKPTEAMLDDMIRNTGRKLGLIDPKDTSKRVSGKEAEYDDFHQDIMIWSKTAIQDEKTKEARLPNVNDVKQHLDNLLIEVGKKNTALTSRLGGRTDTPVNKYEYARMTPADKAGVYTVVNDAGTEKLVTQANIAIAANNQKLINALKSQGLAPTDENIIRQYKAVTGVFPGEPIPTPTSQAMSDAAKKLEQDALQKKLGQGGWSEFFPPSYDEPYKHPFGRELKSPDVDLSGVWSAIKGIPDAVWGMAVNREPKPAQQLPNGDLNPAYVAGVAQVKRWHNTEDATRSFATMVKVAGNKMPTDSALKQWLKDSRPDTFVNTGESPAGSPSKVHQYIVDIAEREAKVADKANATAVAQKLREMLPAWEKEQEAAKQAAWQKERKQIGAQFPDKFQQTKTDTVQAPVPNVRKIEADYIDDARYDFIRLVRASTDRYKFSSEISDQDILNFMETYDRKFGNVRSDSNILFESRTQMINDFANVLGSKSSTVNETISRMRTFALRMGSNSVSEYRKKNRL